MDNSVNSAELFVLLEKANLIFTSQKEITTKIDELISKFEGGIAFFLEDVMPLIQVMKDFYSKEVGKLTGDKTTGEMNDIIVEILGVLDNDWFIREKGD